MANWVWTSRCFVHTLQLAVNDGMKLPAISKAIAATRCFIGHLNHSAQATKALIDAQLQQLSADGEAKETCPLTLIQDVATRWNSAFLLMQRLQQLRVPVYAVIFSQHTKNSDRMSLDVFDTYWATMEAICPVLEPLAEATELLAMASSPTLSCVHVLLKSLLETLNCTPGEAKVASDLKKDDPEWTEEAFQPHPRWLAIWCFHHNTSHDGHHTGSQIQNLAVSPWREKDTRVRSCWSPPGWPCRNYRSGRFAGPCPSPCSQAGELQFSVQEIAAQLRDWWCWPHTGKRHQCEPGRAYRDAIVSVPNPLLWWKVHSNQFPNLDKTGSQISRNPRYWGSQ